MPGMMGALFMWTNLPQGMDQPLPPAPPPTWKGREDRVRWARENFTRGELALLVKLSYDVDKVRRDDCDALITKERTACP